MKKIKSMLLVVAVVIMGLNINGCMPYKKEMSITVKPNETAYVIPLEASSLDKQVKFESIEFLREKKVATRRIVLEQRWLKTGYGRTNGKYIPTETVIVVDRQPVSCQWVNGKDGTSESNQAFKVESMNSIAFELGATMTCRVSEPTLFLYNFPSNRGLSYVANNQIYRRAMGLLTEEFGKRTLDDCRRNKSIIFNEARTKLKKEFLEFGIEITQLDLSGQLEYLDPRIQENINNEFISKNSLEIERNKRLAAEETRKNQIAEAETRLKASKIFAQAITAEKVRVSLDVALLDAETRKIEAQRWNGQRAYIETSKGEPLIVNTKDLIK